MWKLIGTDLRSPSQYLVKVLGTGGRTRRPRLAHTASYGAPSQDRDTQSLAQSEALGLQTRAECTALGPDLLPQPPYQTRRAQPLAQSEAPSLRPRAELYLSAQRGIHSLQLRRGHTLPAQIRAQNLLTRAAPAAAIPDWGAQPLDQSGTPRRHPRQEHTASRPE